MEYKSKRKSKRIQKENYLFIKKKNQKKYARRKRENIVSIYIIY